MPEWTNVFDIHASIKIIRHISAGIYRNPANAMKEQIVNSFDAAALRVDVTLGGPTSIKKIEVADEGNGMTQEDVDFSFQHIGSSIKRVEPEKFESETRPIVGQFGIGMLAAAHASRVINIETTPKDLDYTLKILIDLSPYFKFERQMETLEEFIYGSVKYEKLPRGKNKHGTKVTLAKKGGEQEEKRFWKAMNRKGQQFFERSKLRRPSSAALYEDFVDWVDEVYSHNPANASIRKMRGYEEFMWQLGLILPVEYVKDGPVRNEFLERAPAAFRRSIEKTKDRLKRYDFHVFVDGVEIKKPIRIPTNAKWHAEDLAGFDWGPYSVEHETKQSTAEGYLVWQPYVVRPSELRGIYPRIKGVGVGSYDNTLFRLIKENPLNTFQITGELDLERGFDEALNLDRTGFIETDPAYVELTDYLNRVFNEDDDSIFKGIRVKRDNRQRKRTEKEKAAMVERLQTVAKTIQPKFEVRSLSEEKLESAKNIDSDYSFVKVSHEDKVISVSEETVAENPLLVLVFIAIDKVLQDKPNGRELAAELKEVLADVFRRYGQKS